MNYNNVVILFFYKNTKQNPHTKKNYDDDYVYQYHNHVNFLNHIIIMSRFVNDIKVLR